MTLAQHANEWMRHLLIKLSINALYRVFYMQTHEGCLNNNKKRLMLTQFDLLLNFYWTVNTTDEKVLIGRFFAK